MDIYTTTKMKKGLLILLLISVSLLGNSQPLKRLLLASTTAPTADYPYFVDNFTIYQGGVTTGTSLDITYPSVISENDLLLLIIYSRDGTTIPTPTGFTSIALYNGTDTNTRLAYRVVTGSESGNVTCSGLTSGLNSAILVNYTLNDNASPFVGTYSITTGTSTSNITGKLKTSDYTYTKAVNVIVSTGSNIGFESLSGGGYTLEQDAYYTSSTSTGVTFSVQSTDFDTNSSEINLSKTISETVSFMTYSLIIKGEYSEESGVDLLTGLVSLWEFDETSGTTATDAHGSNNGTISGATVNQTTVTNLGTSYLFDGASDYVSVAHNSSLAITGDISISAWVYLNNLNNYHGIVSKTNATFAKPYDCYINKTTGYITLCMGSGNSITDDFFTSSTGVPATTWTHIAVTRTGTNVKIYINGTLVSTDTGFNPTTSDNGGIMYIGYRSDGEVNFDGKLDQPTIYNIALTQEQVSALYNSGNGKAYTSF